MSQAFDRPADLRRYRDWIKEDSAITRTQRVQICIEPLLNKYPTPMGSNVAKLRFIINI